MLRSLFAAGMALAVLIGSPFVGGLGLAQTSAQDPKKDEPKKEEPKKEDPKK